MPEAAQNVNITFYAGRLASFPSLTRFPRLNDHANCSAITMNFTAYSPWVILRI